MSISTTIKSIQDIMRQDAGVDGDAQRISQLTWLFFLKIFDASEQEIALFDPAYVSPIPDGLGWSEWSMVGLTTIGAAIYAKAGPLAVAIVRGLIPVGSVLIGAIDGLPRGAMWIAIGIGTGVAAWHRDIRLAVRPLVGEGRAIPMLPEMVPSEILDAAGLDERGRPVKRP